MKWMASSWMILVSLMMLGFAGAVPAWSAAPAHAPAAPHAVLWAAPDGHGAACTSRNPCSLTAAQAAVRKIERGRRPADVTVELTGGTYRLSRPWEFGAADSGISGHPVGWRAASGAHPVISGATRVTGWTAGSSAEVWSARVPRDSASRQLYVDGQEAPIAQATPAALHFTGGWVGSATGYDLSKDPAALAWFAQLTPAQLAQVEFD